MRLFVWFLIETPRFLAERKCFASIEPHFTVFDTMRLAEELEKNYAQVFWCFLLKEIRFPTPTVDFFDHFWFRGTDGSVFNNCGHDFPRIFLPFFEFSYFQRIKGCPFLS